VHLKPFEPFLAIEEHLKNKDIDVSVRKKQWQEFNDFTFPTIISNKIEHPGDQIGLSPGHVVGEVAKIADLKNSKKLILATDLLTPNLVEYFPKISGIIAKTGGLLSHLAIMAREAGIPIVSGVKDINSYVGKEIEIDGQEGTVKVIKDK
jgi:phosphohistidine swiveling domain-containing protein